MKTTVKARFTSAVLLPAASGRIRLHLAVLLAAAFGLIWLNLAAPGCAPAPTPEHRLRSAADAYATALEVLTDARRAGLIGDEQAAEIEAWRQVARESLDLWRLALEADGDAEAPAQRFNRAMRALTEAVIEAERRRTYEDR